MKIYTRTGDTGETSLFGGARVQKDDSRVAAYGTVDELNACLGWALTTVADGEIRERLERVQHDLFALGSLLSVAPATGGRPAPKGLPAVPSERVPAMESWIDHADAELPELRQFILPGGAPGAAALHLARTVCRRAERAVVGLASEGGDADTMRRDGGVIAYLNRLSDVLFTFARLENHRAGVGDVAWVKESDEA